MELGQVIVFNESKGIGFIKNDKDQLHYIFRTADCLDDITTGDQVRFHCSGVREAYDIRLEPSTPLDANEVSGDIQVD